MYKILIVDDESIERDALKYIIQQSDLEISEIEEASSGREAIKKAVLFKPDIVLIDIKMPGISGIEAVKQIKKFCPELRILFLTAFDYFNYAQEAIKVGAKEFIVKPAPNDQIIQALKSIIHALKEEKERRSRERETETRLEQVTSYLESEFVALLAMGNIDIYQTEEYFKVLGIGMKKGAAIVVEINYNASDIPVTSALQKGMIKKRCMEKVKTEFDKEHIKTLMSAVSQFIYVILFLDNREELFSDNITRLVEQITQRLHTQLNIPLRVGVGNPCDAIDEICTSFIRARTALLQIKTPSGVRGYFHLEHNKIEQQYPIMKERELCRKMIAGDEKEAKTICSELLDWIKTNYKNMEEVHRKASEMMIVVCRTLSMETKLSINAADEFIGNISKMESVELLKAYVNEIIKNMMNEIRNSWSNRSVLLVNKACEYVRANYMKDITLKDAAIVAGISQYYLSRVFKQVKKLNFVDYLSRIRIEKAKELLKDPSINITEVSNMVGYSDANYFSRVFKRIVQISPSDYRNRL